MSRAIIRNTSVPSAQPINVLLADSFFQKFKGLMFAQNLQQDEGILLVEQNESVINTSIHMLFMNFDITAVWLDRNNKVVDVKLARRWRLAYASNFPAMSVLEIHQDHLNDYHPGDQLTITDA
jgi:uncharacterized membrane protein (UPF0127 family)